MTAVLISKVAQARGQLQTLCSTLKLSLPPRWLWVSAAQQQLMMIDGEGQIVLQYPVSTALKGLGNQQGSYQTPTGLHRIAQKVGEGCEANSIFRGREPVGECAAIEARPLATAHDCITSRILWLEGLQPGLNQGGTCDSYERYIYIHGTHEEGLIGQPASIGCVRMKNTDVINLFEIVEQGDWVFISA